MNIKFSISVLLFFICIQVFGQSSQKVVLELLVKSGSIEQFKQLDDLLTAKIDERKSTFSNNEDFLKFSSMMKAVINSKDVEKYFVEYFEQKTNEDSLKKVISIYNQPLMIEMTKLEIASNDPSKQQDQLAFFQGLQNNPPSQTRIQQLVLLNNELGSSEMISKMFTNIALSMAKGFNSVQPIEKQVPLIELENKIKSTFSADFTTQMTNQIIALSLYTYKNVDDSKLNEYIKVWQMPIGKYFISGTLNAFDYSFSKMFEHLGTSFKTLEK
jgi:hypothetical protein